ncbi:MAG TPA: heme ABC exporter ATP-binding protein CcmA [Myxococcota bacterium]|nr:heme ABC exporter ATP-binding protein CcmA [Myxococcota bacterium]
MSAPALRATGLAKRFGPLAALAPLDLALAPGETLAVLGPNGAGKSTLLRLLAGLARPSAGEIALGANGESRAQRRARVGLLAHATFLTPQLTARENLVFAARLYGVANPEARATELIAAHELAPFAERRAGELSRGMAQRVAIARALVHEPALLLLDEPFTGLDARAAERLAEQLAMRRGSERACVLVTHELARAAQLATRALVLVRGRARSLEPGALASADALGAAYRDAVAALEAVS